MKTPAFLRLASVIGLAVATASPLGLANETRNRGSGALMPKNASPQARPAPSGDSRVPAPAANTRLPQRPQARPAPGGSSAGIPSIQRPAPTRPELPRPQARPAVQPERPAPATRPATRPGFIDHPAERPQTRPALPENPIRPQTRPALPENPSRPQTRPALPERPQTRPALPERPDGILTGERPSTRPALPQRPSLPDSATRPRPERPLGRPDISTRPAIPDMPGRPPRPERPKLPDRWQSIDHSFNNQWNVWQNQNQITINQFNDNRVTVWNNLNYQHRGDDWWRSYHSQDYRRWRHDVWDYRRHRCQHVWIHTSGYHHSLFDVHWWGSCWWGPPRPYVQVEISPWWYWRPLAWATVGTFFQAVIAPQPVVYDPGTTIIYQGDVVYVNGEAHPEPAPVHRQRARELATPEIAEVPVPQPAADESATEEWLPAGVWALTQQEQGDAIMFFQLSVNKEGIVAGAYKNVMTGDEQPVLGQLDFESQVIAWHIGEATTSVYETSLSSLTGDVASVFVHFGEDQTQDWLLVRLPSPEMPPSTVKLPEYETEP
jgi:hypothetical protein